MQVVGIGGEKRAFSEQDKTELRDLLERALEEGEHVAVFFVESKGAEFSHWHRVCSRGVSIVPPMVFAAQVYRWAHGELMAHHHDGGDR